MYDGVVLHVAGLLLDQNTRYRPINALKHNFDFKKCVFF